MNTLNKLRSIVLLLFVTTTGLFAQTNDTLMTINGEVVFTEEYDYINNKNKSGATTEKRTESEMMDMFINYKLKVAAAKAAGLDTMKSFLNEYNGYRKQLAQPYLTDQEAQDKLYKEAYNHLKMDVEVSHILISIPKQATPKDTTKAYKRALTAYARLQGEPFEQVALNMSDDQSVKDNKGYLGFFTGLSTVWEFEKAMYSLPVGEVSKPVRTNYGYHVIKVHSRRPAIGKVKASHIMKVCNDEMSKEEQDKVLVDMYDIYNKLKEGADFAEIAAMESDDKGSARKGGDLSWFGVGRMVKPFEDAAFALQVGEMTEPIRTQFGWHIIKLTGRQGIEPFEKKKDDIRRAMMYDKRSNAAQQSFVNKLKKEYNLYQNKTALTPINKLIREHGENDSILLARAQEYKDVLVAFKDNLIQASEFVEYCALNDVESITLSTEFDKFCEQKLLEYEDSQLENKHPEFRMLMNEYYNGLLLFEISSREVWNKTSTDVKGLKKYFRKNKKHYAWDSPRYKGTVVKASTQELADIVMKMHNKVSIDSLKKYVKKEFGDSAIYVVDRGIWKAGDNNAIDAFVFNENKDLLEKEEDYPVVIVKGKMQKKYPSSYLDVRGKVSSDYQNYLENKWINDMRRTYKIVLYK